MRAVMKTAAEAGFEYSASAPDPTPGRDEVVVKVEAASICGTDVGLYRWSASVRAMVPKLPLVVGHEIGGVVVDVGADVSRLAPGDRVALETHIFCSNCATCRRGDAHNCEHLRVLGFSWDGGFADFTRVPESICVRVPESVSPAGAAMLEPFGVAVHALQRGGLEQIAGAAVLIVGCGPIGLFLGELAVRFGAAKVVGVEPDGYRRGLLEDIGGAAVAPEEAGADGFCEAIGVPDGFDLGFEVSGARRTLSLLLDRVRREGTVVTVGQLNEPVSIDVTQYINHKGLQLRGVFGRRIWGTWDLALKLVSEQGFDPSRLVTHRYALADVDLAMEAVRAGAGKVQLIPGLELGSAASDPPPA